jgi:hypothetical protein
MITVKTNQIMITNFYFQDECSFVSLRDVDRVLQVMAWFYKHRTHLFPLLARNYTEVPERGYDDDDEDDYEDEDEDEDMGAEVTSNYYIAI